MGASRFIGIHYQRYLISVTRCHLDPRGNFVFNRPGPVCTRQNCNFQLFITSRLARLPLQGRTEELFYSTLPYLGVRTWALGAIFEVRKGKLERSDMRVSDFRIDRLELGYPRRLIPLGYEVETLLRDSPRFDLCRNQDYRVFLDHGHPVKMPQNVLHTCVLQTARTPTKRAFDMNLRCLNGIFRGCTFDELAPSAWADYSPKGTAKALVIRTNGLNGDWRNIASITQNPSTSAILSITLINRPIDLSFQSLRSSFW